MACSIDHCGATLATLGSGQNEPQRVVESAASLFRVADGDIMALTPKQADPAVGGARPHHTRSGPSSRTRPFLGPEAVGSRVR